MTQGLIQKPSSGMYAADDFPTVKEALLHVQLVQHVMQAIMKEDTHFGASFPGDTKKNLLKPGADALCLAFKLCPDFIVQEVDLGNGHRNFTVTCQLKTQGAGILVATGVGSCSSMESKYRWRNDKRKCPQCGQPFIIKGKEEYGGGWLCWKSKGGCGATWPDGAEVIEKQPVGKVENTDPADVWNTCLKIAKKRAFVDATITATAASDMFTQDLEDIDASLKAEMKAAPKPAAAPAQAPATPAPAEEEQNLGGGKDGEAGTQSEGTAVNEEELTKTLTEAATQQGLTNAWKAIEVLHKQIPANMMVRLMKVKRTKEASLPK